VNETSGAWNELCRPFARRHEVSVCSYFPSAATAPPEVTVFAGDGSLRGFLRALRSAFEGRSYDLVHAHGPQFWPLLWIADRLWRLPRRSTVFTVQNSYANYKLRNRLLWIPAFASADRVIFCGRASAESYPAFYRRLVGSRLSVVPNGVDLERIDREAGPLDGPREGTGFTVASVGRLIEIKDPVAVVDAFARGGGEASRLVFVGRGELGESVAARARELGIAERVRLTGLVPRDEVFRSVRGADLFVSASLGEGLPVAVLEAMACGCPVVLSDIPPHREIAEGTDVVPLVPTRDVAGFAREIERFRAMPAAERREIGLRCRAIVEERFSLAAMHRACESAYRAARRAPAPVGARVP
jgi:glycosyltransferase involved in cell wall biosynthesis